MDKKIKEKVKAAEQSDAYFVTITRREGNTLYHWQANSFDFYYKDLLRSLEEVKKLIMKEHPGMKYV